MFNHFQESKDFNKFILPCLADKKSYKSLSGNSIKNLAIIKIPTRRFKNNPTLLFTSESNISGYLTLEKQAGATDDPYSTFLDTNIYSLFSSVKIMSGSTVISDIKNYAQYMHCKNDMTSSTHKRYSDSITLASLEPMRDSTAPTAHTTYADATDIYTTTVSNDLVFQNTGMNVANMGFSPSFGDAITPTTTSIPFSFNLKNFLGDAIDGVLPLHLITNNDLIIEIIFDTCDTCQITNDVANGFASMSINDLQYNAILSHIPQSVSNILYPNNYAKIIGSDVKNDYKQIQHDCYNFNIQFDNYKFKYVNSIIFFFQNIGSVGNPLKSYLTQRCSGGVYDYHIMYENKRYPNVAIQNIAEMFSQTLKCFDSTSSNIAFTHYVNGVTASLTDDIFDPASTDVRAPNYSNFKKFVGGISLKRYYSDDKHFTGTDLSKSQISLNLELNKVNYRENGQKIITPNPTSPAANGSILLQTYCMYDVIYELSNGDIKIIH
jgi:hypothetical protein